MKKIIFLIFFINYCSTFLYSDYILKKKNYTAFYNNQRKLYKIEIDSNNDGKIDTIKLLKNNKIYLVLKDENFDGFFETKIFLKNKKVVKIEKDENKDNKPDVIYLYKNNKIYEIKKDKDNDGNFDYFEFYKNGHLMKKIDNDKTIEFIGKNYIKITKKNGDILFYKNGMISKAIINNGTRIIEYKKGKKFSEKIDLNKDGFFEVEIRESTKYFYKKNCKRPIKIEKKSDIYFDNNCNGVYEKIKKDNKILIDKNEDKFPEKVWILNSKGKVVKYKEDKNFDHKYDFYTYYKNGSISKIEIDSNYDGKIDIWKIYKNGNLIKVKKDLNFDGKIDIEE